MIELKVAINIGLATLHTPLGDQDEGNGDADSNNIQVTSRLLETHLSVCCAVRVL